MYMHRTEGRPVNFSDEVLAKINAIMQAHRKLPIPEHVGSVIGIRRKTD